MRMIWLLGLFLAQTCAFAQAGPLQGGVSESGTINNGLQGGASSYPAPVMVPQTPTAAPPPPTRHLDGNAYSHAQRPLQGNAAAVALPRGFLGRWSVMGQRTKVEAMPEYQAGAENVFQVNTSNVWSIDGNPGSYTMSNGQMSTAIWVDKVEGGTAFIRYQHPVKNTMAQEAIVMSLAPNGASFNGLERISIVKEGVPTPRAKVTYQLSGNRQ